MHVNRWIFRIQAILELKYNAEQEVVDEFSFVLLEYIEFLSRKIGHNSGFQTVLQIVLRKHQQTCRKKYLV